MGNFQAAALRDIATHLDQLSDSFVKFRQDLRQLLSDAGVSSNPAWSEDDIVEAFRELVGQLSVGGGLTQPPLKTFHVYKFVGGDKNPYEGKWEFWMNARGKSIKQLHNSVWWRQKEECLAKKRIPLLKEHIRVCEPGEKPEGLPNPDKRN